jgi:DNA-binding response OmpR family regulator
MARLLIIEDDRRLATMLVDYLARNDQTATHAETGAAGLALLRSGGFDLVILDLMLPDTDGLALCRQIRGDENLATIPLLMLTAKGDPTDRIVGLELGADDYMGKPFEPRELLARIRALLRRGAATQAPRAALRRFGRLEIDLDARVARIDGNERAMTSHQFELLAILAEHAGRVLSREQLMELVRGETLETFDRSIDVHIARIRAAIEDDPRHPRRIITVRGAGYVFARAQDV